MDVTEKTLVETTLNLLGFLAASGFWLVLTSRWGRKSPSRAKASDNPVANSLPRPADDISKSKDIRGESNYFNLKSSMIQEGSSPMAVPFNEVSGAKPVSGRISIIKSARQMLRDGASADEIKRSLPVTDSELALLQTA